MTDSGFTIDMTVNDNRRKVAMLVLRARLKAAIGFRRTDAYALQAARDWSMKKEPKLRPKVPFRTMKQALAWVESECAEIEAANGAAE